MADEKKPARSAKLYKKGPSIKPEGKGDTNKSASEEGASAAAKKTAGDPPAPKDVSGESGSTTKGDVMAGTDGIPTHHTQAGERMEIHKRHMVEHADMIGRHERDHLARSLGHGDVSHEDMVAAHHVERRTVHTRHESEWRHAGARHTMPQKSEGTSGTNPD